MAVGPAMTRDEATQAVAAGIEIVEGLIAEGLDLVATGDMGIGNTTAAAAITAVVTGVAPSVATGRGTGLDDAGVARKAATIERAIAVNGPDASDGISVLSSVGGFEIGGLAGVILGAAANRVPVLLDGYISGSAALIAATLCPPVAPHIIAGHVSAEPGHRAALAWLGLTPLLDLGLRLGEGTGAVLAMPLVDGALAALDEMATFAEAAVAGPLESTTV
jgi:nicotinate-nucleotide--dimethylbenzimidazole phosphoribosyltransferase